MVPIVPIVPMVLIVPRATDGSCAGLAHGARRMSWTFM